MASLCERSHMTVSNRNTASFFLFQFYKRLKVSPYIWDSSRSVNLNGGNDALRLAPDRPSVALRHIAAFSDRIRSAIPNQSVPFHQFFKTRCYTCFVQQVSPVTNRVDSALPLRGFPFPIRSYDTCSTGRICTSPIWEREKAFIQFDSVTPSQTDERVSIGRWGVW